MKQREHTVDFCVVGGGLAGLCAAVAAARGGAKTLLMHERPVLGGNASSEIRMWVCGAHKQPETGLVEEFRLENLYRNSPPSYSLWDSILYEKARFQDNLALLLNCSCQEAEMDGGGARILSVRGYQQTTQCFHRVRAPLFADCSGDSVLAPLTGAEFRVGREARDEFGESIAPAESDRRTMGMSCLMRAREMPEACRFIPPAWANCYTRPEDLPGRLDVFWPGENFWWLELGGDRDSIADTELVRDELLKAAFGVWDYFKNHAKDRSADHWALDWVGFLPGKRESRRYVGDHIVTQHDVAAGGPFPDCIAYGGWNMDDHHPAGLHASVPATTYHPAPSPYGLPYRALYSKNIDNLFFAGRNISATHAALSSTRVMATCALLGQAAGSAAALATAKRTTPRGVYRDHLPALQQILMDDDCWLPGFRRAVSALSANAALTASKGDPEPLRNGFDRPADTGDDAANHWIGAAGDWVQYRFERPEAIREIRLVFDSGADRAPWPMGANEPRRPTPNAPPASLARAFHIDVEGDNGAMRTVFRVTGNYQRLVRAACVARTVRVRLTLDGDAGEEPDKRIYAFEVR